jgi:hypothetical protein
MNKGEIIIHQISDGVTPLNVNNPLPFIHIREPNIAALENDFSPLNSAIININLIKKSCISILCLT